MAALYSFHVTQTILSECLNFVFNQNCSMRLLLASARAQNCPLKVFRVRTISLTFSCMMLPKPQQNVNKILADREIRRKKLVNQTALPYYHLLIRRTSRVHEEALSLFKWRQLKAGIKM